MNPSLQNHIRQYVEKELIQGNKRSAIFSLIADDDDIDGKNRMKVLNDGDGMKLLFEIWQTYISDDDYVSFPSFIKLVDDLLLKFRNGKPLTREERQEMNEASAPKKRKVKKKKPTAPVENSAPPPVPTEMSASDTISRFVGRQLKNKKAA